MGRWFDAPFPWLLIAVCAAPFVLIALAVITGIVLSDDTSIDW